MLSNITTKTLPDGSLTETRGYDTSGNLTSLTHFNGKTTTYAYDPLNRLATRTPDPSLNELTVSYTYTSTGKHATTTDASGTTTYVYDALDRQTAKITPEGTLNYTYDAASNVASISSSNANGASVSYTYDTLNRLSAVVDNRLPAGHNTTSYVYDTANNLVTAAYPNGLQSTFHYDAMNRLTAMTTPNSGYLYQLGATGNRTSATELTGRSVQWSYDGIYRLTNEAIASDPAGGNGAVSYSLDAVGNRTANSSSISGINSVRTINFSPDDLMLGGIESYDANGNTIATGGRTFTYDSENHLVSMNGGAVTLVYDADGNRVAKTVGGVTMKYLVDDLNPTGYPQVMDEVVGGTVARTYSYGLQRIDEDQIVGSTWTPSFYGYDGGGTVRQLTNLAGTVKDTYNYDAFGNKITSTGSTPNEFLYRGEQFDTDLGLYYLRARYYNPSTGRFMGRDPEDGIPPTPVTMHKYVYADGDPVDGADPSGRSAVLEEEEVLEEVEGLEGVEEPGRFRKGAIPAVAALGCTVSIAYNFLALKVAGATDIRPTVNCRARGKSTMRIQLQLDNSVTVAGTPVITRDYPPGVSKADVYQGLNQLYGLAGSGTTAFPFNANKRGLYSAIVQASECVNKSSGTLPIKYTVCQGYVTTNTDGWRVDVENINGENLAF